jgi:CO dehydrogenase maturation factor
LTYTIAVAGKGGSGKTSLASLIIRYLVNRGDGPVLAVDADANANLGEGLGLSVNGTIGGIIATFNDEKLGIPPGLTKEAYLKIKLNETIVESRGVDLVTMGRGEGPACYCYPNNVLRHFVEELSANYRYVVIDNEAGMEHLSRRTSRDIDELLLVSGHSVKGVRTIARIRELVTELKLSVAHQAVVINLVPDGLDNRVAAELGRLGLEAGAILPYDDVIKEYDLEQRPLLELSESSPAVGAVAGMMLRIIHRSPSKVKGAVK